MHKLRRVYKVLRNTAPGKEASLVDVDDLPNLELEARSESFADGLDRAVLQGDGAEGGRRQDAVFLGEQHHVSAVDALKLGGAGVEAVEQPRQSTLDRIPGGPVEAGPKPSGPGALEQSIPRTASWILRAEKGPISAALSTTAHPE